MNLYGQPYPIPLLQTAEVKRANDEYGNTPYPLGLLQMPMQSISWLLYRAKTAKQKIEWTPLVDGPGTRVNYDGAAGWDGSKFTVEGDIVNLPDPMDITNFWWGGQYASPQAARDGVRGYDVFTTEDPNSEDWSFDQKPGQWLSVGPWAPIGYKTDGTMRYTAAANWPGFGTIFTENVAAALSGWGTRLTEWLSAENAKVPKDLPLIADIQRQMTVYSALQTRITAAAAQTYQAAIAYRQGLIDVGVPAAAADRSATLYLMEENDGYARWVAGEEILEAFSATNMPLQLFRGFFPEYVKFLLSKAWFGWDRSFSPNVQDVRFLGAGMVSSQAGALTSGAIPALSTGQIAVNLSKPLPTVTIQEPYGFNFGFVTVFTDESSEYPITDGVTTEQAKALLTTAIGPTTLGFTPGDCRAEVGTSPSYNYPVQAFGSMLSGKAQTVDCPPENPECSNVNIITFGQLFGVDGSNLNYSTAGIGTSGGSISWAFQSPYTTPSGGVGGLRELWKGAADLMKSLNTTPTASGEKVGVFRIEDASALGTSSLPGLKIYECPLFATAGTVQALNITWKILSVRS